LQRGRKPTNTGKKTTMKRILQLMGATIAVAALAYFIVHAHRALAAQDLGQLLQPRVIAASVLLLGLYMALTPLTAVAWTWLLRAFAQPTHFTTTGPILAATQFGKYLPGNIAQHLGRVVLARAHDLGTGTTVLSMAYETLLVVVAGAHVATLTFLWAPPPDVARWSLMQYRGPIIFTISAGAFCLMLAAPGIARVIARFRSGDRRPAMAVHPGWTTAFACYLTYALNFGLVGLGLWVVAASLTPTPVTVASLLLLTGAFAGSWVFGFLTPGAPAGLGIREAILSVWLAAALGPSVAISLIIVLRIVTTLGDFLNFVWGSVALTRRPHAKPRLDS
jgi:hypothetical protein